MFIRPEVAESLEKTGKLGTLLSILIFTSSPPEVEESADNTGKLATVLSGRGPSVSFV